MKKIMAVLAVILFWNLHSFAQTYDLPLFLIDTHGATIVDDPKVSASLRILDHGTNVLADSAKAFMVPIGIEIRGQTSASFDQKGYGFEVQNSAGDGVDTTLLGLPKGDDWILHGPYVDKSLIRNALASYLYQGTGRYSSRSRFVELFLNKQYQGVYLLLEKIKRGKNRVNISKLTSVDTTGDSLTGGYIFRIDKSNNIQSEGFLSSDQLQMVYQYPKKEDMNPKQEAYLKATINAFEAIMRSTTWNNPTTGYPSKLDVDAAVDYILHEELTKNSDAYFCSFYMYKERDSKGGRISMGPPWDFNLAFGEVSYNNNMQTSGWQAEQTMNAGTYKIPEWLKKIFGDAAFKTKMATRWGELRSSSWHSSNIKAYVDSLQTLLSNGADRHFARWKILGSATCVNLSGFSNFCFNGYSEKTWPLEVSHMQNWFLERINWIDQQFKYVEPLNPTSDITKTISESTLEYSMKGHYMELTSSTGGRLIIRNVQGQLLWNSSVPKGRTSLLLPARVRGSVWIASLNGRAISGKNGFLGFTR